MDLATVSLEVMFGVPFGDGAGCLSGRCCSAATVALSGSLLILWRGWRSSFAVSALCCIFRGSGDGRFVIYMYS